MNKIDEGKIMFNFIASLKSSTGGISEISHPVNFEVINQKIDSLTI